jgi:hypothetical protein
MPFYPSHYFKDEHTWGIATYAVSYDDGSVELANVYYGRNVGVYDLNFERHRDGETKLTEIDIDIEGSDGETLPCYYTRNHTWVESLAYSAPPIIGNDQTVFYYEWKNPHPDKTITQIRPYHIKTKTENDIEQTVVLFGIVSY